MTATATATATDHPIDAARRDRIRSRREERLIRRTVRQSIIDMLSYGMDYDSALRFLARGVDIALHPVAAEYARDATLRPTPDREPDLAVRFGRLVQRLGIEPGEPSWTDRAAAVRLIEVVGSEIRLILAGRRPGMPAVG